jgi:hypothetical protein
MCIKNLSPAVCERGREAKRRLGECRLLGRLYLGERDADFRARLELAPLPRFHGEPRCAAKFTASCVVQVAEKAVVIGPVERSVAFID